MLNISWYVHFQKSRISVETDSLETSFAILWDTISENFRLKGYAIRVPLARRKFVLVLFYIAPLSFCSARPVGERWNFASASHLRLTSSFEQRERCSDIRESRYKIQAADMYRLSRCCRQSTKTCTTRHATLTAESIRVEMVLCHTNNNSFLHCVITNIKIY